MAHPQPCLLCLSYSPARLCAACQHSIATLTNPCRICALPLPAKGLICPECLANPPAFAASRMAFCYQEPLASLVRGFKDRGDLAAGEWLARALIDAVRQAPAIALPSAIVAVPCHPRQRWQRGLSPSGWLAEQLSAACARPVVELLYKTRPTLDQRRLGRDARLRNLQQAFALAPCAAADLSHLWLVDDVVTTTATARITSQLLRAAGAREITLVALARVAK